MFAIVHRIGATKEFPFYNHLFTSYKQNFRHLQPNSQKVFFLNSHKSKRFLRVIVKMNEAVKTMNRLHSLYVTPNHTDNEESREKNSR